MSVEKRVISVFRDQLGIPEERITPDLFIMGEIDSPDQIELIMELEEEFDITIPNEEATKIDTVADAIRYVKHQGAHRPKGATPSSSGRGDSLWDRDLDG
jgi:acyl carrier protein